MNQIFNFSYDSLSYSALKENKPLLYLCTSCLLTLNLISFSGAVFPPSLNSTHHSLSDYRTQEMPICPHHS